MQPVFSYYVITTAAGFEQAVHIRKLRGRYSFRFPADRFTGSYRTAKEALAAARAH